MNYTQLLAWVNDPARTRAELRAAADGFGLPTGGTTTQLRVRLVNYLSRQPAGGVSPWSPAPAVAPATPPVAPAPGAAAAPAAVAPRDERLNLLPVFGGGLVVGLLLAWLFFANPFSWGGSTQAAQPPTGSQATMANWASILGVPAVRLEQCPSEAVQNCVHVRDGDLIRVTVPNGYRYEGWSGTSTVTGNGPTVFNAVGATVRPSSIYGNPSVGSNGSNVPSASNVGSNPGSASSVGSSSAVTSTGTTTTTSSSVGSGGWPATVEEAAKMFGGAANRWEKSAEGGWHLREEGFKTLINPAGYVLEGYYDTQPGKDPRQFVSNQPIELQGATIWRATSEELYCAMGWQKFQRHGISYDNWKNAIDAVGFNKPVSCVDGKPAQAQSAAQAPAQSSSQAQTPAKPAAPSPAATQAPAAPAAQAPSAAAASVQAPATVPSQASAAQASSASAAPSAPSKSELTLDVWSKRLGDVPVTRLEQCKGEPVSDCVHVADGQLIQVSVPSTDKYEGWDGSKTISGQGPAILKVSGLTVRSGR